MASSRPTKKRRTEPVKDLSDSEDDFTPESCAQMHTRSQKQQQSLSFCKASTLVQKRETLMKSISGNCSSSSEDELVKLIRKTDEKPDELGTAVVGMPMSSQSHDEHKQIPFTLTKLVQPKVLNDDEAESVSYIPDTPDMSEPAQANSKRKKKKMPQRNKITNYLESDSVKKAEDGEASTSRNEPGVKKSTKKFKPKGPSEEELAKKNEMLFKRLKDYYGLFGAPPEEEVEEKYNYFLSLPDDVVENILCQIPILDLLNCRLVCCSWNIIIGNEKFMFWKKLHHGLKVGRQESLECMQEICKSNELTNLEGCIPFLIKFVSNTFFMTVKSDGYNVLIKDDVAADALLVMKERFPDLSVKESKVWGLIALAIILSEKTWQIERLYDVLSSPILECNLKSITNFMYCIASFLLYFRMHFKMNGGYHYRLYHVLYSIENNVPNKKIGEAALNVPKGIPGQQSMLSYCNNSGDPNLTYEQLRILNHHFQPNQIVKIIALAGTGKTTTLIHLARLYPQVNFLTVMFNKALCQDAKQRFPPNVTVKTCHSLAYNPYGLRLRHKLSPKIRSHDIVGHLKHHSGSHLQIFCYAKHVLTTIEKFIVSTEETILLDHVPTGVSTDIAHKPMLPATRNSILQDAKEIFNRMIDRDDVSVRITHDVYLKLFQLNKPKFLSYQCIMLDEAQDCTPVMLDLMFSQKLPVILVGDPNQQIYKFRGAENALQNVEATHTYHLTKSFRFGTDIAYVASTVLQTLKRCNSLMMGADKPSTVYGKVLGQYAIIARTNLALFNEAVRICCQQNLKPYEKDMRVFGAFAGGISGYQFDQLLDVYRLNFENGKGVTDKFISKFKSINDLKTYAKNAEDGELSTKIELVNMHGSKLPEYISLIKHMCSTPIELASIVFSTAHKAKGLQFDTVCLTDDYPISNRELAANHPFPGSQESVKNSEEANILYVAMTRAKQSLILSEKLLYILFHAQERFEFPKVPRKCLGRPESAKCIKCCAEFEPHTVLIMFQKNFMSAKGRAILGGALCIKCGTDKSVRPRIEVDSVIIYTDAIPDNAHRFLSPIIGPLSTDPPPVQRTSEHFSEFGQMYVITVNSNDPPNIMLFPGNPGNF